MQIKSAQHSMELQVILDGLVFSVAYLVHFIMGYASFLIWIFLIIISREMVKLEPFSLKILAHSIIVSAPIGILCAGSAQDIWALSTNVSALIGCLAAIASQQILAGDWFPKVVDVILEKIRGSGK